jgi:maleylpyruvate isomerase
VGGLVVTPPEETSEQEMPVTEAIEDVVAATERLLASVDDSGNRESAGPSLLPGWSRGHVAVHLARNADGHVSMIHGAIRGELVPQYASRQERADAIERGARRPAPEILGDLHESCRRWHRVVLDVPPAVWNRPVRPLGRSPRAAQGLLWARLREVEVHHVDLDRGYGFNQARAALWQPGSSRGPAATN